MYYGFKLGRPVGWATGFPFNAGFRHPQYVGSIVSQLGILLLLNSPATHRAAHSALLTPCTSPRSRCTADSMHRVWHR